jgi:hypothetical protein
MTFKEAVATEGDLPSTGNNTNDARITNDTGHLYIWDGTQWVDQGDIIDLTWDSIAGKPSSTPTQIDNAVSDSHAAHSDDQDLSGKVDKVVGSSLVPDTEIAKIHAQHSDDQDLSGKEDVSNKSTDENLGLSDTLYPSQKAVKEYVDNTILLRPTTYYFTNEDSGIGGYYLLSLVPDVYNMINDLVILNTNTVYFPKQFSTVQLGGTEIPAGIWEFNIFRLVNNTSGTIKLYVNGVLGASVAGSAMINGVEDLTIGADSNGEHLFNGFIEEVRVSKGIARWTAAFTPPAVEYSSDSYTKLLLPLNVQTVPNMVLQSVGYVSNYVPTSARVVIFEEDIDVMEPNVDLKIEVSRDGGTTFTACLIAKDQEFGDGTLNLFSGSVDLRSQPNGELLVWKLTTQNNKDCRIRGVSLSWR